jgi:hypothetical protein
MKVIIDGVEYIAKPEPVNLIEPKRTEISAKNDVEAARLWYAFEPQCPECGHRAFPTNFSPESVGGKKDDKSVVWFCGDMGHCAFSIDKTIKWQKKEKHEKAHPFG